MSRRGPLAYYWDASAVLSALLSDEHSRKAQRWTRREGIHVMSSLCFAEVRAVIARIRRERDLADLLVDAAVESLSAGPWRRLHLLPDWRELDSLAERWPLRGADLWHLATAKALKERLDEVAVLAFDARLLAAAESEGLGQ